MSTKNQKIQKRLSALLLALIMLISNANVFTINAFAETNSTDKVDNISESNRDYSMFATGDLTSDTDLLSDDDALTNEEFDELINSDLDMYNDIDASTNYPSVVDNSKSEYFPKIRSQAGIGSCVCWAEVYYAYTYARCRALDIPATDENIMSPAFVYNQIKVSGGGTWSSDALSMLKEIGTPYRDTADFESYIYESKCRSWFPEQDIWEEAAANRITGYTYISNPGVISSPDDEDLDVMKKYLSEGYLITYSTNILGWTYRDIPQGSPYAGESIVIESNNRTSGHRMTIVGYNDNIYYDINGDGVIQDAERGAFKIANSWGTDYENDGFCWISYDALNSVSQASTETNSRRAVVFSGMAVQYVEPEANDVSGVNLVMTFNTPARNELKVYVVAENTNAEYVKGFTSTNGCNYLTYALDGSVSATDGTLIFDLNNVVPGINADNVNNYTWSVEVYDYTNNDNSVIVKELSIEADGNVVLESETNNAVLNGSSQIFEFSEKFQVESFTVSKQAPIGLADTIDLVAKANGGSGEYEYKFGTEFNGKEYDLSNGYTDSSSAFNVRLADIFSNGMGSYTDYAVGYHELFVVVRDKVTGKTEKSVINHYEVKPLQVKELKATTATGEYRVGQTISLHADVEYESTYRYNIRLFYYTFNGKETQFGVISSDSGYDKSFTPEEAGEYIFRYYIKDNMGQIAEKTITVNVLPEETKSAVVYYNNPSWNNSNIHFKVDNGSWTPVPGVKMEESDNPNYKWMYTIDLGDAAGVTLCFNNGNGSWDSKNGQNYYVGAGKYGISNGVVEEIGMTATVDIAGEAGNVYATVNVENGTAPYTYEYNIYRDGNLISSSSTTDNKIYVPAYAKAVYQIDVKVTDASGNVCNVSKTLDFPGLVIDITPEVEGPQKVGTELKFNLKYTNYYYEKYPYSSFWSVTKDGESVEFEVDEYAIVFTPQEEGTYVISHTIPNYMGEYHSKSITYEVIGNNVTTVYYKNSSWQNAYVHYKTDNGSWTSVPGVKMGESDIEGYDWKYEIDLENSKGVTLCFNNGNGSWDSNNGSNYYLEKGTYGIADNKVAVIQDDIEFIATVSVDKAIGGTETRTTINVATENGTPVKYSYYVYPYGSEKAIGYGIENYNYSNYGFTPYVEGTYTIEVEVTDDKGNVATAKIEKYVVEGPKFEYFTASVSSPQETGTSITLNSKFVNIQYDRYNYYYFVIDDGTTTETLDSTTSDCGTAVWTPEKAGTYTITAVFSTFSGAKYEKSMEYVISGNEEFTATVSVDKEIGGTETKTTINVATENGTPVKYSYYVYPYGSEKAIGYGIENYNYSNYGFTPYVEGTYTIEVEVTDDKGNVATDKIEKYVVEGPKFEYFTASVSSPQETGTSITLNSKFVNFQYDRYNYYYFVIDDGTTTETLDSTTSDCGTAVWTPEKAGTYTITAVFSTFSGAKYEESMEYVISGNEEFTATVSVDKEIGGTETRTTINVATENGTPVKYSYYVYPYGSEKAIGYGIENYNYSNYGFTPYVEGTYTIEVEVTDDKGNVATAKIEKYVVEGPKFEYFTASVSSPQETGTSITLNSKFVNFRYDRYNYYYFVIDDGTTTETLYSTTSDCGTAVWTPEKAGTYTITAVFSAFNGVKYEKSMEYVISGGNVAIIYYDNSSWTNAYIHFQVNNGSWTEVPGVKMEQSDKSEYKWMYTIDLGDQDGASVCFNNGENSWDSRNASNYSVNSGTYAIVNGNVIKLS